MMTDKEFRAKFIDGNEPNEPTEAQPTVVQKATTAVSHAITTMILSFPLQALGVWAFWNWLAWNVLNAPRMNYWVACAAVITITWFIKLFKKGS